MLDKAEFIKIMTGLCDFYKTAPSEFILDVYYSAFQNYKIEEFSAAVRKTCIDRKYNSLPKPAEIIEYLSGTRDDRALMAWITAKEAVKKIGYYNTPEFDDPIISNCICELGGWMEFCSIKIDDLPFIEKRFCELYRVFDKRDMKEKKKLIGFINQKNIETGYEKEPSIKIGNKNSILQIGNKRL